jgi:hypothetical protein
MSYDNEPRRLKDPTDYDELYPGRYIKSGEFKGQKITLTMVEISLEELPDRTGKRAKGVLVFEETRKSSDEPLRMVLNRTNGECIKAMFGKKLRDWSGKQITLFPAPYEGETAIRVWGSPDIKETFEITIELPRKRPFKMTMHKTEPRKREHEPGEEG